MRSKFITLEGIEGVGKSTVAKCIHQFLEQHGVRHIMTREPGGTEIAESIRGLLLQHYQESMDSDTELLLMFAARAQHLSAVIRPMLSKGFWVVSDRFTDASYAYQGGGRQIKFERIQMLEQYVHPHEQPDLTFLLTAPVELALKRARGRDHTIDRFEKETLEFFERAQNAYLSRAQADPKRFFIVDSSLDLKIVIQQIELKLAELI